jgi:diguanylate cyclase (GGDEF)-like protein
MILRSVRRLRDAAVATARGEPQERVVITDGPVELRQLANAFNEMTAKLEFQAFHDQLTGLANRRYIGQRLDKLVGDGTPFAVLAVDLDGFKPINDTHGHATGDLVLAEAAKRLSDGVDGNAFIGRTGGDEFLAIVVCGGDAQDAVAATARTAEDMLGRLTAPVSLSDGTLVNIGGCIGIAFWPRNGATAEEVIREADTALYRAKKAGGNRFMVSSQASRATEAA